MLARTIVEKFSEPMAMDTYTGLRLRAAVIPPLAKAEGSPDRAFMDLVTCPVDEGYQAKGVQ